MKKKNLLFVCIVSMLVCLFAISVSARTEDYDATFTLKNESQIVHYENWYYNDGKSAVRKGYTDNITVSFIDENGAPLTEVAMWEYDEADGKYYSLVWYITAWEYVTETQTYTDDKVGTQEYPKFISAVYTLSSVRAVDLRYVTASEKKSNTVWAESQTLTALKGIYLTSGTPDDTSDDIKLQDSIGIGRDTKDQGYQGWEAQFNATGNKIVVANLRDCTFEADTYRNYGTSNTWSRADHLQCIWYPDTVKYIDAGVGSSPWEIDLGDGIEVIACQILRDNKRIKEFTVPNSVKFINNEAFRGTDLTKLTVGEGLISHGNDPYLYTGGADYAVLSKKLLESTYQTGKIASLIANQKAVVYFNGTLAEAEALYGKIYAQNNAYKTVGYYDYTVTQERASTNELSIFYNYNTCEAFYRNEHMDDNNPCTVNCNRCGLKGFEANPVHNYLTSIEYTNYLASGTKISACKNAGCEHNLTPFVTSASPIITEFKGFSVSEDGDSITFGYTFDNDAIAEFEKYNGKIELGFVVAVKSLLGDSAPLTSTGDATSANVVKAVVTDEEIAYTGADFILRGDWNRSVVLGNETVDIKDVEFYMAGYLTVGGTATYLNVGASGNTADTVTFNACNVPEIAE